MYAIRRTHSNVKTPPRQGLLPDAPGIPGRVRASSSHAGRLARLYPPPSGPKLPALADVPERKNDLVEGKYLVEARKGATVAVKVTDMAGEAYLADPGTSQTCESF